MPSPFPGMDPYLESPSLWPDFHSRFINVSSELLIPSLRPRYSVRIEERIYLEFEPERPRALIRPDLTISDRGGAMATASRGATGVVPVAVEVVVPEEVRETYLVIRRLETERVVTIIEILSPSYKRPRSPGREDYLEKRNAILKSDAHLVEIDLLRGGEDMPMRGPMPPGDYHVILSRRERRPQCDVYSWPLRERLPEVPMPLATGDPDVSLNLQSVLDTVYDRAGYDYAVDYAAALDPPPSSGDASWVQERLEGGRDRGGR